MAYLAQFVAAVAEPLGRPASARLTTVISDVVREVLGGVPVVKSRVNGVV